MCAKRCATKIRLCGGLLQDWQPPWTEEEGLQEDWASAGVGSDATRSGLKAGLDEAYGLVAGEDVDGVVA